MKKNRLLSVLCFCSCFCICSCTKEYMTNNVVSLHDTLISASRHPSVNFDIDMDNDNSTDVELIVTTIAGQTTYGFEIKANLFDNCEILSSKYTSRTWQCYNKIDTTYYISSMIMPKRLKIGDTINSIDTFTVSKITIAHTSSSFSGFIMGGQLNGVTTFSQLVGSDYFYIGIKKNSNNKTYIGWIKLMVLSCSEFKLNSYKLMTECDNLIISE